MSLSKEARMQMAISAYKNQQIKSKLKAAQIFGVPESTLRERLAGIQPRSETRANSHKLTAFEEEVLVKRLIRCR
jgi:helix-turn-helix, Psq domain.